ncbi:hypothetical protein C1H76_2790 [Elsinoe australis]|uniref:Uncharacterized protein n=1 Tax=Elsinoe australis TaxID=40998 RepID=A0A4U7BAT2_9PEZI|nr:hypothetical protein C1H76_2790 [Elsinoe australis]
MSSSLDDRWLYLGFGVVLFAATHLISHGLTTIANLNTISPSSSTFGASPSPSSPEDSLALATLSHLATSPNADIFRSSTLILLERLAKSQAARQSVLDDLFSPCAATRRRAKKLHQLYESSRFEGRVSASPTANWRGLIDASLNYASPAAVTVRAVYWHARALAEKGREGPMRQLEKLAGELGQAGLGFVLVWPEIKEVQVVAWINVMLGLLKEKSEAPGTERFLKAMKILEEVGEMEGDPEEAWLMMLMRGKEGREMVEGWREGRRSGAGFEGIDGDRGNLPLSRGWDDTRRARFHEESAEVAEVRRRRREAMVFREGGGTVNRSDIIQH